MGEILSVDLGAQWSVPVCIDTPVRLLTVVKSPKDALRIMTHTWMPETRGEKYFSAKRACIAAMCGTGSSKSARYKFIAACREAKIRSREIPADG